MTDPRLLTAFPLVPLFGVIAALAASMGGRDITRCVVRITAALQGAVGLALAVGAWRHGEIRLALGDTVLAIEFAFGADRIPLLSAYLLPLGAAAARAGDLASPAMRLLLLLYLGGCSGLIVTADLFNFFVFYELMMMAAYVLVGAKGSLYASVKYMLFGALSSSLLLGGIVLLYATGAGFREPLDPAFLAAEPLQQRWTLLLLASAFLMKSAFVPAWTWVATCHAATVTPVSALLGSYTLMAGLYGLQTRVLAPAAAAVLQDLFGWIEALSIATVSIPSLFVLVEAEPKRCVAASSVVAAGFVGWLMARGRATEAMLLIAVHAAGKTLMFYALDGMQPEGRVIALRRRAAVVFVIGTMLAVGLFPTPVGVWKSGLADTLPATIIVSTATVLTLAGLLKFGIRRGGQPPSAGLLAAALVALAAATAAAAGAGLLARPLPKLIADAIAIAAALPLARQLNRLDAAWSPQWRRRPYPHLNAELLGAATLLATGAIWLILPYAR
ncbi:MAG: proton-conducting transporter membrane subunit [Kiritimatiellae bacterium]|nr:proton-conducting transporter membrane subunit [Kiritimatiellia bacterium]